MKKIIAFIMTLVMVLGLSSVGAWAADATWQVEKPLPTAKFGIASSAVNDKIYVLGGSTSNVNASNYATDIVEIYDPKTDAWSTGTPMPIKKFRFSAATMGGKIYVFGGLTASGRNNTMEIYDCNTNTWSTGAAMSTDRVDSAAFAVNNKIYVIGGESDVTLRTVEIYDPQTNSWTAGAPMPSLRSIDAAVVGTNIYVLGNRGANNYNYVEAYNTETNTWSTKKAYSSFRTYMASIAVGNKIYAIGGAYQGNCNTVEIYSPETDSWSTGPSINIARSYATSSVVGNKIYLIGGSSSSGPLNSMESLQVGPIVTTPEAPTSLTATGGNAKVDLSWGAVSGATSYTVKRSTTAGGPYAVIAENVTGTTYTDTSVTNGTTYYYVVTAVNSAGSSTNSNEASATPTAGSGGGETGSKALLVITMTNGLEKEYELTTAEINAFINWYDSKADGSGAGYYKINKTFNLGPFLTRADYLTFDKIQNFEVMQYQ